MKNRLLTIMLTLLAALSTVSMVSAQDPFSDTITDVVVANDNFDTLEAAVIAAGLADDLTGEGPILVFAPTDAAFDALPEGALEALLAEDGLTTLIDVLTYHVVTGPTLNQFLESETQSSYSLTALNGDSLFLEETGPTSAAVNGVEFTEDDLVLAANGLIVVIDQVLLPPDFAVPATPEPETNTVVDVVVGSEVHTTLETAVVAAGLAEALASEDGDFAVFAPTDAAFDALPEGALEALLAEDDLSTLTSVLAYHVVSGQAPTEDGTYTLTTLNGATIEIVYQAGAVVSVNDVAVAAEVIAGNGAVFVIDQVLLPPDFVVPAEPAPVPPVVADSITDIVVANDDFSTLETAVVAAGLAGTLAQPGAFTVFAPTDAAFAALDPAILEAALADPTGLLTDVLLYHVVAGEVPAADVVTLSSATTLQGSDITIEVVGGEVILNGNVRVIQTDIQASNGIIHVIDAVLLPSAEATNPPNYPEDSALIIPSTVDTFLIGEEIIVPVPDFAFPEEANGSYLLQIVQYPDGVNAAPTVYKSAQHWDTSGNTFVFFVDGNALANVQSYIVITPYTFEQSVNAATGATEFSYTPVVDAPSYYTEGFTIE